MSKRWAASDYCPFGTPSPIAMLGALCARLIAFRVAAPFIRATRQLSRSLRRLDAPTVAWLR